MRRFKRAGLFLLLAALAVAFLPSPSLGSLQGDMNDDATVTLADAILIMKFLSKMSLPQPLPKEAGVGGDQKIGLDDLIYVLQVVSSLRGPSTAPPALSNIALSFETLPVPRTGEQLLQTLTFDFMDPNGDLELLEITLHSPEGTSLVRLHQFPGPAAQGTHQESYSLDPSFTAGTYRIDLEAVDSQGNRSGVSTASFTLSETAERAIEITGLSLSEGSAGDVVVIEGHGFIVDNPSENIILFNQLLRSEILSVTSDQIEVVVPVGALSGPIILSTPAGRTQSLDPFTVTPSMMISPVINRLLTGKTVDFMIVQSGLRSTSISCSINGQAVPDPSLGTLELSPSGFAYTSPQEVPGTNPVSIRCEAADAPGVYAEMEIDITAPVPPPGIAVISSVQGGTIESVQSDVRISIPSGAVAADTSITVQQLDPDALNIPSDTGYIHAAIRLEPSGLLFSQPVAVSFPLRNWVEPGTLIPLHVFDEVTGSLENSGHAGVVDESGIRAEALIDHFSVYAALEPYTVSHTIARQALPKLLPGLSPFLFEFELMLSPDMPLLEGLSVPVLVKRREAPPPGMGPFISPSQLSVSVVLAGYPAADTPASVGPILQASPDGWELGTVINIGTLPDCNEGNNKTGSLNIGFEKAGSQQSILIPFSIQCLDELSFSGSQPPAFVPDGMQFGPLDYFDYKGLRVRQDQHGKFNVLMLYPGETYRFSKMDIGPDGILKNQPYLPPIGVNAPYIVEVTGDVRVAGKISLAGAPGNYGYYGGYSSDDCGGEGGRGVTLNSGAGGPGGPWNAAPSETCLPLPCPNRSCYQVPDEFPLYGGLWVSHCNGGHDGQDALLSASRGGHGGEKWEKGSISGLLMDVGSFIRNTVACVEGAVGACIEAAIDLYDMYGETVAIAKNDDNYIKAAGGGGNSSGPNAPPDIAYFNPPVAGGGGGGSGKTIISLGDDKAGGGGGSGGGAAANLKLVVGGRVTIEPSGEIDGKGGRGGKGGDGEDGVAAPGGGGGGGSGSAVHIIALKGLQNNNLIYAPGGLGGESGEIKSGLERALVDSAFGRNGYTGRLRVDGPFEGSESIAMPMYRGPRLIERFAVSLNSNPSSVLTLLPGGYAHSHSFVPQTFDTTGLQTVTATVRNLYTFGGRQYDHTLQLHPWQKGFVFYFPGVKDSDGDGLADGLEASYGTDPNKNDTDGDGLLDGEEVLVYRTNPLSADTDGDGVEDGTEVRAGSDPLNAASTPEICDGIDNDLDGIVDEGCLKKIIAGGYGHTLSIKPDGTLWAWGINNSGQLGVGTTSWPTPVPVQSGTDNDWLMVSAGQSHSLGLKSDGTLWSWGYNMWCALGLEDRDDRHSPAQIGVDNNWVMVSAGNDASFGLKSDGTLWAWGKGSLGDGESELTLRCAPVPVGDNDWAMVSMISGRGSHTLALKQDRTLWAWGNNNSGQLGVGDSTISNSKWPVQAGDADANDWAMIAAGSYHSLALKTDGTLWAWGNDSFGQLGDESPAANKYEPVQIGDDTDWAMIAAGLYHSLALKSDGTLWAWGHNLYGQVGDGSTENKFAPTRVGDESDWIMIAAGHDHNIALKSDGTLWTWGSNQSGQLGDGAYGSNVYNVSPTRVDW